MYLSAAEAATLSGTNERAVRHRRRRQSTGLDFVLKEENPQHVFVVPAVLVPLYSAEVAMATRGAAARYETETDKVTKLAAFAAGFALESNADGTALVGLRALPSYQQSEEWRLAWLFTSTQPVPGSLAETIIAAVEQLDEGNPNSLWDWISVLALITPTKTVIPLTAIFGKKESIDYLTTFSLREMPVYVHSYLAQVDLRSCQISMTLLLKALSARYPNAVKLYNVAGIAGCICYARAAAAVGLTTLVPTKLIDPEDENGWSVFTANNCLRLNRVGGGDVLHDIQFIRRR